MPLFLFMC
jgi:hypothetical protein